MHVTKHLMNALCTKTETEERKWTKWRKRKIQKISASAQIDHLQTNVIRAELFEYHRLLAKMVLHSSSFIFIIYCLQRSEAEVLLQSRNCNHANKRQQTRNSTKMEIFRLSNLSAPFEILAIRDDFKWIAKEDWQNLFTATATKLLHLYRMH